MGNHVQNVTLDASIALKMALVPVFGALMMEQLLSFKATTSLMRKLASRTSATTRVLIIQPLNIKSVITDVSCVKTVVIFVRCVHLTHSDTWANFVRQSAPMGISEIELLKCAKE